MDIEMAGSLYPTERAATRAAVSEYMYANGLNDDAYVLDTLRMAGHGVLPMKSKSGWPPRLLSRSVPTSWKRCATCRRCWRLRHD